LSSISVPIFGIQYPTQKVLASGFWPGYDDFCRRFQAQELWSVTENGSRSVPEAALQGEGVRGLARVSPNAVYTMVRRGEVPAVRFGSAIRIPRDVGDRKLNGEAA
jgi:hypothetical protein